MRVIVLLVSILFAGTCFAEDPLETLNTVEDTLSAMQQKLNAQATDLNDSRAASDGITISMGRYFISDEPLGTRGWIKVRPCAEAAISHAAPDRGNCVASTRQSGAGSHFWKSRAAVAADLRPGRIVVARDQARDGAWFLAKITDISEVASGYVAVSAPLRAQLKSLRVVEE